MTEPAGIRLPLLFTERMKLELGEDYPPFENSFLQEPPVAVRLNPGKWKGDPGAEKVPWCSSGYYLKKRPLFTADPWLHGGAYYVQEPHSMFLEQAVNAAGLPPDSLVLDLCAAPGGKTTHIASLLRPGDLLVTNEVIRSRAGILVENVRKWGFPDVVVTQNDPKDFAPLGRLFDLIVIDAPCSGEGLFRKDSTSAGEWSWQNAEMCASRQKRILAEAWKCLKPGGHLIYSTCTYNPAENEENIAWLLREEEAETVSIPSDAGWKVSEIRLGKVTGYRFLPHLSKGEGFFLSMVRKKDTGLKDTGLKDTRLKDIRLKDIRLKDKRNREKQGFYYRQEGNRKTNEVLSEWINRDFDGTFIEKEGIWHAFPSLWMNYLPLFEKYLTVLQTGTPAATGNVERLIPHPALALSLIYNRNAFPEYVCNLEEAIRFLRKDNLPSRSTEKGWMLVTFMDIPLGWLKNLGNRTNNYFPGEWRIRMEIKELPTLWHNFKTPQG